MKILFICSCLEPGKDGVGDYTRHLAKAINNNGNYAAILAINDKYVNQVTTEKQLLTDSGSPLMRIPSQMPVKAWINDVKRWVKDIDADWFSLQFVPFGFHKRGLPLHLAKTLLSINSKKPWHIMFHELWVGMAKEESFKLHVWGSLQKVIIKNLLKTLNPKLVHTQTALYQRYLQALGYKAELLPLFGNIPVVNVKQKTFGRNQISFVVFGLIHSSAPIETFAKEAAIYSNKHKTPVTLTFIGRCGPEQERWLNAWKGQGLFAGVLGEQTEEKVSEILSDATFGISATATAVIEKSGSVAAMLNHGLQVISLSKSWTPKGALKLPPPQGVVIYHEGNFEHCVNSREKPAGNTVWDIENKLVNSLLKA